jgi:hypothetical protein
MRQGLALAAFVGGASRLVIAISGGGRGGYEAHLSGNGSGWIRLRHILGLMRRIWRRVKNDYFNR